MVSDLYENSPDCLMFIVWINHNISLEFPFQIVRVHRMNVRLSILAKHVVFENDFMVILVDESIPPNVQIHEVKYREI